MEQPLYISLLLSPYAPVPLSSFLCQGLPLSPQSTIRNIRVPIFACSAPYLWNQLADQIRFCTKLSTFKSYLKIHVLFVCLRLTCLVKHLEQLHVSDSVLYKSTIVIMSQVYVGNLIVRLVIQKTTFKYKYYEITQTYFPSIFLVSFTFNGNKLEETHFFPFDKP